ncbi:hypothetical protein FOXG_02484 [Fusarium oxysporum f. sp. lycopersici 4287]|uniref:Uncharacterized protein n=2 Tax=Fusarium oxysporum TaxID=5507 RepID=A0A0J9UFW4_FUSO4|nr:hypothetical protein FOXG_02484 [Fusarium oxysporum f. sp. lycopersici 4287]KNA98034.1 hypothetical protein FOXG_02484 [Fusarium oxysporum f. sp. lycopersici 4287]
MTFIVFNNSTLAIQLNNAVSHVSLFNDRGILRNSTTDPIPLSGTSQKLRIMYTNNNPPPRIFTVKIGVAFPENTDIKLTGRQTGLFENQAKGLIGGGPNDTYVEATDNGHRGVWSR